MVFVDRGDELAALETFWHAKRPHFISVSGRRRVGKTTLLERFAEGKHHVYFRCRLADSATQLQELGEALARASDDAYIQANPPSTWESVFALVERLAQQGRLLLALDELPYWVSRDESVPSVLQNWWDGHGRHLPIMCVVCGSAVQTMERLLRGEAPLAGCLTGRLLLRPLEFPAAFEMLDVPDPVARIEAYCIFGGMPLYLSFYERDKDLRGNILDVIANPTGRLYVEPQALFASHHESFDAASVLGVLRAMGRDGKTTWSGIAAAARVVPNNLNRIMTPLVDMGLVRRELPVTERKDTKAYHTQYHITDPLIAFWFKFIEPNQGYFEGGDRETVVDEIMAALPPYLGTPFELFCREWVALASARSVLPVRVGRVGTWWSGDHEIDIVGCDDAGDVALTGECKWQNQVFDKQVLDTYLGHVAAMAAMPKISVAGVRRHVLCSKTGFTDQVVEWAKAEKAILLTPDELGVAPERKLLPLGA